MTSAKIEKLQSLAAKKNVSISFSDDENSEKEEDEKFVISKTIEYKTGEVAFTKLDQRSHVLHRPDMYVGSINRIKSSGKIWVKGPNRFECKEVYMTEALLRIFMEVVSNAIDNIWRSKERKVQPKLIEIDIDRKTGWISVWNDGLSIPLGKFKDSKTGIVSDKWTPEEIFGELLIGSNYDDEEKRKTSGMNGLGSKLVNVLSKIFEIELFNPEYRAIYRQRWTENMSKKEPAVWDRNSSHFPSGKGKGGYTLIRFKPDYSRFGYPNGIDDDMISVLEKSIHDYAMIAALNDVSTIYNGVVIPISGLKDYVSLYYDKLPEELLQLKSEDCSVIVAPKADPLFKGDLMHVAFINGIITAKGGVHVDAWDEAIFRPIVQKINGESSKKKKDDGKKRAVKKKKSEEKKRQTIDISHVRKYFSLFIVAEADNPRFTGQNKETFNSPEIHTKVKPSDISKLMKWSFVERIEESMKLKEFASLKDAGKKKRNYLNIPNLDDANNAGHVKLGKDCILCLTEGDSAASYVAEGMQFGLEGKIGHDSLGIFPLRGKLINCRKAPVSKILKNKEIMGIIRALGLEYGVDYSEVSNRNKLRYGKLYTVADGDADGCCCGNTPINMPSGISIPLEQLDHFSKCVSWHENCDGLMPARITKFMDKGFKDVVKLTFEDGRELVLTPDHKLCSSDGKWIEAKDAEGLQFKVDGIFPILNYEEAKSDWILNAGSMKFSLDTKANIDRTLAFIRILGLILSDGHLSSAMCAIFVGNVGDCKSVLDDAKLFIDASHIKVDELSDKNVVRTIKFRSQFFKDCISLKGVMKGNRSAQSASLPEFLFEGCPLIIIREFLGGLFGGDGVSPYLMKYRTRCSKQRRYMFDGLGFVQSKQPEHVDSLLKMMEQIGSLLQLFDVRSYVKEQFRKRKDKTRQFKLFILKDDYLKFADKIGFRHCSHKSRRLSCVQSYYRLYDIVREQRQSMQKRGLEFRAQGKNIDEACRLATEEFRSSNLILHPASIIIPGNLKYSKREDKYLKNLHRSGFDDACTFLRKIDGLKYFIDEEDIKLDKNRQGTAHYGNTKNDLFINPLKLKVIQVKYLTEKRHVYDLSVEDPTHCFLAGGIVAHNCHITGLVTNFFDTLFPSLVKVGNFLHFLRIPIVKINMKQETLTFLFYHASQQYISSHQIPNAKKAVKYFKGLGTFRTKEIGDDFGRYPVALISDEKSEELISRVFGKDDTEFRKQWLLEHQNKILSRKTPDFEIEQLSITNFLEDEMRLYSLESCVRAIPCVLDGFKESSRKIICSAFTRPLNYSGDELKVVQLAGYVAEKMGYHHGEQNIPDTIIGLAQSFPGANNIPLLVAAGNFGSRQGGGPNLTVGDDAAAPRYIFTKLEMLTRYIFREEDDEFLPDRIQDGEVVEKQYYMPIIPMLLVNGTSGIGTAHSTTVPQYNPLDLMQWIEVWLDNKGKVKTENKGLTFYETPTLCPFYRGFTGKIEVEGSHIKISGIMEQTSKHTWTITELPLGRLNISIKKYGEKLKKMREEQKIKSFTSQKPTLNKPYFTITADEDGIIPNIQNMKLVDSLATTNMVLFDEKGKLMKFSSIEEILEYYCARRYAFYTVRIEGMLKNIKSDLKWVVNKLRFIRLVHDKTLDISNREESELDNKMDELKFDRKVDSRKTKSSSNQEAKDEESSGTFDYLLSMQIKCLNVSSAAYKKLEKEKAQFEEQISDLENTTVEKLWKQEMNELKTAYTKWERKIENESKSSARVKKTKESGK